MAMINVDISNVWGELSLPDLLAVEAEVSAAHRMLMEGTGAGGGCRGWLNLPEGTSEEEITRILEAATAIRENCDALVVIGSGGGCLGARAAIELLQGPECNLGRGKGDPQIFFAGNSFSTGQWNRLLKQLEGKDYSLCVISRSGDRLETAVALRNLRWNMERRYGTEETKKRILAVTGPEESPLGNMARAEGWTHFHIPESVTEAFCVLSPAGLLPMAVAGLDIRAVLQGAQEAKAEYDLRSFENPVWLYAAVRNLMQRGRKTVELLQFGDPALGTFGRWWQQLFAGAEGKAGTGLFPAFGGLPGDLDALGQFALEGRHCLLETVLSFDAPAHRMHIGEDVKDPDGLNYLAGKTLDQLEQMACAVAMETHAEGGTPVISMACSGPEERTVGELFWFFQLSSAVSAYIQGVDPFSMTGAEAYRTQLERQLGKPEQSEYIQCEDA